MKGINFLTDETHHKRYVQLDLEVISNLSDSELEDILDIIVAEARKNDEKIFLDDFGNKLKNEGLT